MNNLIRSLISVAFLLTLLVPTLTNARVNVVVSPNVYFHPYPAYTPGYYYPNISPGYVPNRLMYVPPYYNGRNWVAGHYVSVGGYTPYYNQGYYNPRPYGYYYRGQFRHR